MMRIVVDAQKYEEEFVEWLVDNIKQELLEELDIRRVTLFKECIFDNFGVSIDIVVKVVHSYIKSLHYNKYLGSYVICFNDNLVLYPPGLKVVSLIKLINYGSYNVRGYSLFSRVLNRVASKLRQYYNMYQVEVVRKRLFGG